MCKQADHERLIFIELNRAEVGSPSHVPDWAMQVDNELAQAEKELTVKGAPAPPAYVFVTNRGAFIHNLDSNQAEVGLVCGFKIDDFASRTDRQAMLPLVKARERHKELHWLRKAIQTHGSFPSSFDDRLPEEESVAQGQAQRLLIGLTYLIPNEKGELVRGILMNASVTESDKLVYGTYKLQSGAQIVCVSDLTDAELAAYRRSPETFFGVIQEVPKGIHEPLDCYDFFWQTYSAASRTAARIHIGLAGPCFACQARPTRTCGTLLRSNGRNDVAISHWDSCLIWHRRSAHCPPLHRHGGYRFILCGTAALASEFYLIDLFDELKFGGELRKSRYRCSQCLARVADKSIYGLVFDG